MSNFEIWGTKNYNCNNCEENEKCKEAIKNNQCFIKYLWRRPSFTCPHCNNLEINIVADSLSFYCNQCSRIITIDELKEADKKVVNFIRQEQPFVGYLTNEGKFNFYSFDIGLASDFHAMFCFSASDYDEFEAESSLQFYTSDYGKNYTVADNKNLEETKKAFLQIQEICKCLVEQGIHEDSIIFASEEYVKLGSISEVLNATDINTLI